jgi:NAD(P)-dependent dehydrogenase (short-subunit alcohol dehydrogenase family)
MDLNPEGGWMITGANRGLGFETARQLGQQGVTVIVAAGDSQKGDVKLEVTNKSDQTAAAKFVEEKFGHLDILINNAGSPMKRLGSRTRPARLRRKIVARASRRISLHRSPLLRRFLH